MPLEFSELSASRLQSLKPDRTAFFFPVGPLEDHGPHLPLGLDLMEARELCRLMAERVERDQSDWTCIIMPAAPLGVSTNTTRLAMTTRAYVLRDYLVDSCMALFRMGFVNFVCFSGQLAPRQLTAIEDAGKFIARKTRYLSRGPFGRGRRPQLVSASSALVSPTEAARAPFWPLPPEHGGARDTSLAMAMAPGHVDPLQASLPAAEKPAGLTGWLWARMTRSLSGYWGNPADGRAEAGRQLLNGSVEEIYPKLRAVWESPTYYGGNAFRSWYSILPPNQSTFKGWVLALLLICLMMAWMFLALFGNWGDPG